MDWSLLRKCVILLILSSSSPVFGHVIQCCPEKLSIIRGGCSELGVNRNITVPYNIDCDRGMFLLDPSSSEVDNFRLDEYDGLIVGEEPRSFRVHPEKFCLGDLSRDNRVATTKVAMVCAEAEGQTSLYFIVKGTCAVVSVVFLVITAICYFLLPELRDLQGKCMLCAIIALAVGFLNLCIVQLEFIEYKDDATCVVLGLMIYIWMLSFFFWLNVVSFNLWRSVVAKTRRFEERQLFCCYSAYAWGCPLILVGIMMILQYGPTGHKIVGHQRCFLSYDWSFVMFYLVIAVILLANTIMFAITAWKLWKGLETLVDVKRRSLKYKCCMYLKLFLISGLTWLFEIVSYIFETFDEFWIVTDVINGLQGFLMFLVLIALRPRALRALAARGFCCLKMPQRWRHRRDTELLHDDELDDDEDGQDDPTRTITEHAGNGL